MDDFGLTPAQRQLIGAIFASVETEGIEKVAVFGSRATGRHRPNSDLDLVVYSLEPALCDRLWTLFDYPSPWIFTATASFFILLPKPISTPSLAPF